MENLVDTAAIIELTVRGIEHKVATALTDHVTGINEAIKKRIPEVMAGLDIEKEIDYEIKRRIEQEITHQVDIFVRYNRAEKIKELVEKYLGDESK